MMVVVFLVVLAVAAFVVIVSVVSFAVIVRLTIIVLLVLLVEPYGRCCWFQVLLQGMLPAPLC